VILRYFLFWQNAVRRNSHFIATFRNSASAKKAEILSLMMIYNAPWVKPEF